MRGGNQSFAGSWRDLAVFGLLAVMLAAAAWIVGIAAGPFEADPDYIYLLNGLELLTPQSPAYYTHPGTPVELIAAIVIAVTWLFSWPAHGFSGLQDHVLEDPGFYLGWINIVFAVFIAAALVFFACRVRKASGRLFPAIVGALSVFLPLSAFLALHRVNPEPVLLAGGLVLAGFLAPLAFAPGVFQETKRFAISIGFTIGFCIAVKATAAPLLIMILLLRGSRARMTALVACVLAAVLLTLPVASHYLEMTLWYVGLFTHQGGYGNGAVGVPGLSVLAADAVALVTAMPETFACLILYFFVLLAWMRGGARVPGNSVRVLIFCLVFVAASLLLVLKQPEARYTIPTVPLLCLGNAIVAQYLVKSWGRAVIVAGLVALELWTGNSRTQQMAFVRHGNQDLLRKAAESGCLPVFYYAANTTQNDLYFGDGWTQSVFKDKLARLYPNFVSYDNGVGSFENFSGPLTQAAARTLFERQKCVYLVGSPMERFDTFGIPQSSFSLVAKSPGGPKEAVAVYALKPNWDGGGKN